MKSSAGIFLLLALMSSSSCSVPYADPPPAENAANEASTTTLHVGEADIAVDIQPEALNVSNAVVIAYVKDAAEAVSSYSYLDRFPIHDLTVRVRACGGTDVGGTDRGGKLIELHIGRTIDEAKLRHNYVATHEMFRAALPSVGNEGAWINEGLAAYLEPVARAGMGTVSPEEVWREFLEGVPQAIAKDGDENLNGSQEFSRTYWGGCLYWLLADIRIREQTDQKKTLADAVRGIFAAGTDGSANWNIDRVIINGDLATGTTVLRDLQEELGAKPLKLDLQALWARLGVDYLDGNVTFNQNAPLAAIREAITARKN